MIAFFTDILDLPNFSHMTTILMYNVISGPNLTIQVNEILIRLKEETEYGRSIFPYSVWMRKNVDQNNTENGHFPRTANI